MIFLLCCSLLFSCALTALSSPTPSLLALSTTTAQTPAEEGDEDDFGTVEELIHAYIQETGPLKACPFCNEKLTGKNHLTKYHQHLLKNHALQIIEWFALVDQEALPKLPEEDQAALGDLFKTEETAVVHAAPAQTPTEPITGKKRYPCTYDGCTYTANRKGHLQEHIRSHTGERPFKCPYDGCQYAAARKSSLSKHQSRCWYAKATS